MKLLGLPGRKLSTLGPMGELVRAVRLGQTETEIQTYGFWDGGEAADPDIGPEAKIAAASGADIVIAKSIGVRVATQAMTRNGFSPRRCVFIGAPLRLLQSTGQADLLGAHSQWPPTLFIQQTADPTGPFSDLAALVCRGDGRPACVEIPGDDHLYVDIPRLAAIIDAWNAAA